MARVKVTRNYQVTIPEEVRGKLGIEEGYLVSIDALGKTSAIIRRIIPVKDLAGAWDEEMDNAIEEVKKLWAKWRL